MTVAEALRADHEDMRTIIAVLFEMANRLDTGVAVPPDDLAAVLDFLDSFVERSHRAKEEMLLYPVLAGASGVQERAPLEILTAEHEVERNLLAGMHDAVARWAGGDGDNGQMVVQYARDYAALLARDVDQEDEVVYPFADAKLPADAQQSLLEQFAQIEKQVLGDAGHDPFHAVAHTLAERYLN